MVKRKLETGNSKLETLVALAIFEFLFSIFVLAPARAGAQQPQTLDAPVFSANAKYVQGMGPGYWATAGSGLTLNIAAGTAYCGHPQALVSYAGGSLALASSATNYVYLDPAANCAPASNPTGFAAGQIPIAKVVTGASSITSVTEARNWFVPQPIGTDASGRAVSRHLNSIRFADQFPGSTSAQKLDAALADIGTGTGLVVAAPPLAFGPPSAYRNDVGNLDHSQTHDVIGGVDGDPDRAPLMLLDHRPGSLTTKPVTGSVTLTNGSTAVTGTGTQFLAQFANRLGRSIKLDADPESAWRQVASVQSDTQMTLTSNYNGAGGTGPASYFITHLGLVVFTLQEGGNPQTGSHGESVGVTSVGWRVAGSRGLWGMNSNVGYDVQNTKGAVVAQELDISNYSATDGVAGVHIEQALRILSAGPKRVAEGIFLGRIFSGGEFDRAITINNAYANRGIHIKGPSNHLYLIPNADNNSAMISGRNAGDSATKWAVNNDGSSEFSTAAVGPATSGFGALMQDYLNEAENRTAILNPASGRVTALLGGNQNSAAGVNQIGVAGVSASEHASGTKAYVAGLDGEAFHETAGTVSLLTGVGGFAAMSGASGTVTKMASLYAYANDKSAGTVTNNYGLYVDPQTAGTNNFAIFTEGTAPSQFGGAIVSGPATSSFGTLLQGYLNDAENRAAVLNPASGRASALMGVNQNNGSSINQIGVAGVSASEHASGTKAYVAGLDGEAFHETAGTVSLLTGVGGFAAMSGASGTVTKMASLYAYANDKSAGTVTNNYGLYVDPQTAGTNNFAVFTAGTSPSQFGGAVISGMNTVSFSSTPTFDARLGNTQKITLTGNVTSSTLSNPTTGEQIHFVICQDATGSRTFAWPSNVKGGMTIGSTASTCNAQNFIFDGTNAYALSPGATNL